ncbi:putative serine/threonine protein kinase [Mimivirus AB-566-O17]|uniref:Putative serine/threonine protein kinase n=1 Tax=Mimivirus AB-566-O17 TaxID=1988039 RepID=A0A1X9VNX3_9VIRU|nr:putative serine/threonine protein kinase [Mimivirus AB-566-O17]
MALGYKEKVDFLSSLRQRIKRKKIIFDESRKNFGFEKMKELISVKNTSEIKGYPFECYNKDSFKYALKIVPSEKKFNKDSNPSKLEILVLKKLTQDLVENNVSPHITYYLTNLKIPNRCTALKCIDLKRLEAEDRIHRNSHVLVSEYIEGGCLDDWVYSRNESSNEPSSLEWKCIVFQVLYTLFVMENKYRLNHNDTHYGNILMDTKIKAGGYFVYRLISKDGTITTYYTKNGGFIPKMWDFEFAMVYSDKIQDTFPNKFVIGDLQYDSGCHKTIEEYESDSESDYTVPVQFSEYYDAHYFLCSLLDLVISRPLFDWIMSIYPECVIPPSESDSDSDSDSESESDSDSDSESESESVLESSLGGSSVHSASVSISDDKIEEIMTNLNLSDGSVSDGSVSEGSVSVSSSSGDSSVGSRCVKQGRLVNGRTSNMGIPTTIELLRNGFFDELKNVPEDYQESESVIFEYRII